MSDFSPKALKLILDFEGLNQPGKWPGGASGVTIGIGYDLGYVTVDQYESDWGERLGTDVRGRLKDAVGLRAVRAKNRAPDLADIRVRRAPSEEVFTQRTIPLYTVRASQAFPGFEALPADVQGALVSLVYNRGASMVDDSPVLPPVLWASSGRTNAPKLPESGLYHSQRNRHASIARQPDVKINVAICRVGSRRPARASAIVVSG